MAFWYEIALPDDGRIRRGARLMRWLVEPNQLVDHLQPLAELSTPTGLVRVLSNALGILLELLVAEQGELWAGTILAKFAAEGEDLPCGRPYVVLENAD
jgi:pyruvate/2-oxoglutarate dehydrogenase complex dihydrolipoamide acyltransferase (E2) component